MSFYLIVLFLHILGAAGIFLGLGMEGIIFKSFTRASTVEQVLSWGPSLKLLRINFAISSILLLVPGIYLATTAWTWTAWIILGLIILTVLSGSGNITGKKIGGIMKTLGNPGESLSNEIRDKLSAPILLKTFRIKILLVIGTVFIMTLKTNWLDSIITILAAFIVGLLLTMKSK